MDRPAATALSTTGSEIVNRIIALAARGDPASISIIRAETSDLPEHALARTLESLIGRRPRPRNPAGYVVNTLRALRAELGLPAPPRIDREPPL